MSKSDVAGMSIKVRDGAGGKTGAQILSSAEISNAILTLRLRREIKAKEIILLVYDDSAVPKKSGRIKFDGIVGSLKISLESARAWVAVALEVDGVASAPAPILNATEMFARISRQRKFRDLAKKASRTGTGLEEIEELVEDLRSVLFDEWKPSKTVRKGGDVGDGGAEEKNARQLSYEDFVIPLKREEEAEKSAAGGSRSTFDVVLGTILASLGGTKVPLAAGGEPEPDDEDLPEDLHLLADTSAEKEEQLAAEAAQAEGESESSDDEDNKKAGGPGPQPNPEKPAKNESEAQFETAERYARKFAKMARDIPEQLESRFEGDRAISIHELEVLLTSARLFTGLVGRIHKLGLDEVEYLAWEDWADAQVGLLNVLTTSHLQVLKRLPWNRAGHAALRELHEGLAGWCLSVRGYLITLEIEEDVRMRLRVGLRLAGQILGVDQGKLSKASVLKSAEWILGHRAPGTPEPVLDFEAWSREVGKLRNEDLRLRNIYRSAGDVAKARAGLLDSALGMWVWWPHMEGHIGLVLDGERHKFELLYEVKESVKIVAGYMVKVG